jgi:signal transduction histidine kinase
MLRRILLNLIVNAARAIPEGGWIRLSAAAKGGEGGGAVLEVRDNGHGIDDADLDKVFEPYYTRAPGGTGLGLAIVRRLVEAHGWRVELESEKGVGTVVRLVGVHVIPDEQRREENPRRR